MQITWKICKTYDEARNYRQIIYLHERNGKPVYWGKSNTYFGGKKGKERKGETSPNGRYNKGYSHWIDGCLQSGAILYLGKLDEASKGRIAEVEKFLICHFRSEKNGAPKGKVPWLEIEHLGDEPLSVRECRRGNP